MDYGEVLTRAARLIWRYKILWAFGLLAGLASGSNGSESIFSFNVVDIIFPGDRLSGPFAQFAFGLADLVRRSPIAFIFSALLLVGGIALVVFLIGAFGRAGLARGAWLADSDTPQLSFSDLTQQSTHYFWRVAGLTLLVGVPGVALVLIFASIFFAGLAASFSQNAPSLTLLMLCIGLPLTCLLVPLFWLLGIWSELSIVAVVGEGLGVIAALRRGWGFINRHLGQIILTALIILLVQIVFGFLVGLVMAPLGIGAALGAMILGSGTNFNFGLLLPLLLVAVPVSLVLGSLLQSYIGTLWVLVFRRLAAAETPPAAVAPPAYPTMPPSPTPPGT